MKGVLHCLMTENIPQALEAATLVIKSRLIQSGSSVI